MTLLELAVLLLIAAICGAIGQSVAGYSRGGCLAAIALGFLGALLGSWIARKLGLPELLMVRLGDVDFPVLWSIAGSALFVAVIAMMARPRRAP